LFLPKKDQPLDCLPPGSLSTRFIGRIHANGLSIVSHLHISGEPLRDNHSFMLHIASLFCVTLTAFRFIFGLLRESDSLKLIVSNCWQLLTGMACNLFAVKHYLSLSAYISAILYGTTLTIIFPLLLSIPHEFGLHFTGEQISNMMLLVTISMGISGLNGELMKRDPNAYQFSLFGWSVIDTLCGSGHGDEDDKRGEE
jgi:hypothetical protein